MEAIVKPIGGRWIELSVYDAAFGDSCIRYFDPTNGVVGSAGGNGGAFGSNVNSIVATGNGYYRCRMQWTMTTPETGCYLYWAIASGDGTNNYAGDITKGLGVYGSRLIQVL